jgi:release factor glutamine methyltransferase
VTTERAGATVAALVADAVAALRDGDSPTPRLDAELLLAHVIGRDRAWVVAHPERSVEPGAVVTFRDAVARRATGEPVAYIRGYKEWLSLRIRTDARALVPRPETEALAEAAITDIGSRLEQRPAAPVTVWEIGTGSGAVAVAFALRFRTDLEAGRVRLIATDRSADALDLAAANLAEHGVISLVTLAEADLLAPAGSALPRPDVVVANLPYLPTADVDASGGSLAHEPRIALDGGPDGLVLLRRLFGEMPDRAAHGASLLLEVALGQADAVAALAPTGASVERVTDLSGIERVIVVRGAA